MKENIFRDKEYNGTLRNQKKSSSGSLCSTIMFAMNIPVILWWNYAYPMINTISYGVHPKYNFSIKYMYDCQLHTLTLPSYIKKNAINCSYYKSDFVYAEHIRDIIWFKTLVISMHILTIIRHYRNQCFKYIKLCHRDKIWKTLVF